MRVRLLSQLPDALARRHAERCERARIDEAADAQPVPDLEAGEPLEEFLVEGRVAPRAALNVALDDEVLPDGGDVGARIPRPQGDLVGRHGPAALRGDLLIALDRLLQSRQRSFAHERHVDAVGGAQPVIEIAAHLIALLPLLRRDRAAIGEAAERIERVEGARRMRPRDEKAALQDRKTCRDARHAHGEATCCAALHRHGRIKGMIRWRKNGLRGGLQRAKLRGLRFPVCGPWCQSAAQMQSLLCRNQSASVCSLLQSREQTVDERRLARQDFLARLIRREPFGAIDLGKGLALAALRRPLHLEMI